MELSTNVVLSSFLTAIRMSHAGINTVSIREYRATLADGTLMGYRQDRIEAFEQACGLSRTRGETEYAYRLRVLRVTTQKPIVSWTLANYDAPVNHLPGMVAPEDAMPSSVPLGIKFGIWCFTLAAVGWLLLTMVQN
jgi:hypothetical protein